MSYLKKSFLPFLVGLLVLAGSLYAATSPTDPPNCDGALYPGCNPPINVSENLQLKTGILSLGSLLRLAAGTERGIDFNSAVGTRPTGVNSEGKIGYAVSGSGNVLDIFGGGASPSRKVYVWDQLCAKDAVGTEVCKSVLDIVGSAGGGATGGAGGLYGYVNLVAPYPINPIGQGGVDLVVKNRTILGTPNVSSIAIGRQSIPFFYAGCDQGVAATYKAPVYCTYSQVAVTRTYLLYCTPEYTMVRVGDQYVCYKN